MVTAQSAPRIGKRGMYLSYILGIGTVGLAVAQLVSFEEFIEALQQYQLASYNWTVAIGLLLISLEVFSVPFLLRLPLSKLAWACSAICALVLPFAWTLMTVVAMMLDRTVGNAGYFGGFVDLPVGGLALVLDLIWLALTWVGFGKMGGHQAIRMR